jgi:hypothetical protein
MKANASTSTAHRRARIVEVGSRAAAATVGGFVASSAWAIASAALLVSLAGWHRGPAVHAATMASFVLWALMAMWCFYVPRVLHVWLTLFGLTLCSGAIASLIEW